MKAEELHRKEGSMEFHQNLLSSLKMGAESEERPQQKICYMPGDEIGGLGLWEWRFAISLLKLLYWSEWPVGSYRVSAGVGGWDKAMGREGVQERKASVTCWNQGWGRS